MDSQDINVVLFFPGTTGTELNTSLATIDPVWPDQVDKTLGAIDDTAVKKALELINDSSLKPTEPLYFSTYVESDVSKRKGYGVTAGYFADKGWSIWNATGNNFPTQISANTFVAIGYDWRPDVDPIGSSIATPLELFLSTLSTFNLNINVYFMAHSMGGYMSRVILSHLSAASLKQVKGLITLGTPHYGAPLAMCPVAGVDMARFLETQGSSPTFPSISNILKAMRFQDFANDFVNGVWGVSTYELLPMPSSKIIHYRDKGENYSPFEYSSDLPDDLKNHLVEKGLNTGSLSTAGSFWGSFGGDIPSSVPVYAMYGYDKTTCGSFHFTDGLEGADLKALDVDAMDQQGDGIVPANSAQYTSGTEYGFKGVAHLDLAADSEILDKAYGIISGG